MSKDLNGKEKEITQYRLDTTILFRWFYHIIVKIFLNGFHWKNTFYLKWIWDHWIPYPLKQRQSHRFQVNKKQKYLLYIQLRNEAEK